MHGGDGSVFIHEYAYWPAWSSKEDAAYFVSQVKPWLESIGVPAAYFALQNVDDYISKFHDTSLVDDGELTLIGRAYANVSSSKAKRERQGGRR